MALPLPHSSRHHHHHDLPQWLPWREQLRLRRVCRTWCSVVHDRVTAPPRGRIPNEALPALLRCNLRALTITQASLDTPLLPTTLRQLCAPYMPHDAGRYTQLDDLTVMHVSPDDMLALCSLHTLTRLRLGNVGCSAAVATQVAAALTRLHSLAMDGSPSMEPLLLHAPPTLKEVSFFGSANISVVQALQGAPLSLHVLRLPVLIPLPLERWPQLRELEVGNCNDAQAMRSLLHGLAAACTSLRKLRLMWAVTDVAVAPALGDLTGLQDLELLVFCVRGTPIHDALAMQLPRLHQLTSLSLSYLSLVAGRIAALTGVSKLGTLVLRECQGESFAELAALVQLRSLSLMACEGLLTAPATLESLCCTRIDGDLAHVGRFTALRRLELVMCELGSTPVRSSWASLVRLEEVVAQHIPAHLPRTLLYDLEATLPALRRVELVFCARVDSLPLTSRVRVEVVD